MTLTPAYGRDYKNKKTFWNAVKTGEFESMIKESSKGQSLGHSQEVFNMMKPVLAGYEGVETCWFIFMDSKNRILAVEKLATGSLTQAAVYPREVVKAAIAHNAAAAIMVHNHPSGNPAPSPEDFKLTKSLELILGVIGCTLHEHMIIGDDYYSMADHGDMHRIKQQNKEIGI